MEDRFPQRQGAGGAAQAGDVFKIRSGDSGGYGSPLEWLAERVADDARQGYVSVAAAAELYGVVVDPATFAADAAATERLRAGKRTDGRVKRAK
jgi:N-methylhydantoinase B